MGIYDRDYYRAEVGRRAWSADFPTVCKWLIICNVGIYVLQVISGSGGLTALLELDTARAVGHLQVWRFVTYAFCHNPTDVSHILFNMLFLWWFGSSLEVIYGSREFLKFYLVAAVVSAVFFVAIDITVGQRVRVTGASGAVMAIMAVYAMHFPRHTILLFFVFPVPVIALIGIYILYDLIPVLQMLTGQFTNDGIAHSAHVGGLAYGFAYYSLDLRRFQLLDVDAIKRWFRRRRRPAPNLRVYHEPRETVDETLDDQVDRILKKIAASGESSLNDRERQTLIRASQKYRERHQHDA